MNIISLEYAGFFLVVFFLFYALPHRHQWKLLLTASIFFYMSTFFSMGVLYYIAVPAFIGIVSYGAGILIERAGQAALKKKILIMSLVANIGVLVFFKYVDFVIKSVFKAVNFFQSHLTQTQGVLGDPVALNLLVPLGISYITFQAIGYTIEVYRGNHAAEKDMGLFFTYLMFFPKLFAGPIERAHHFMPQLREKKSFDYDLAADGLKLIVWGLFKKLVIAEQLTGITDPIFKAPNMYTGVPLIVASLFFTIQLYADFSGYTDIAIGSANVLGFRLMKNFDFPFIARSTTELWRRWHISLSTWFFEYVYNPLAIAKRDWGSWAVIYASLVTFFILGLWHGASWKFVVFGLLQGLALSVEFLTRKPRKIIAGKLPEMVNNCLGVAFTFCFFSFSAIFFRAENSFQALTFVRHLFSFFGDGTRITSLFSASVTSGEVIAAAFWTCVLLTVEYADRNFDLKKVMAAKPILLRWAVYYTIVFLIMTFGKCEQTPFIYFKF